MSARSASARKKVTDVHNKGKKSDQSRSRSRPPRLVTDYHYEHHPYQVGAVSGHSNGSGSHSEADFVDGTGIEKSGLRSMMDKKSDGVRRGLAKTFTFNKKKETKDSDIASGPGRPGTQTTMRQESAVLDLDGYGFDHYPQHASRMDARPSTQPFHHHEAYPISPLEPSDMRLPGPPPSSTLPPVPQSVGPPIRRFAGGSRPSSRWNKLRKDPELWDPNGDVLVYLGHKEHGEPPSLRVSSHIIEATRNRYLVALLRHSFVDAPEELPSPRHSPGAYWGQLTPPVSETGEISDSEISYEMRFPPPPNCSRADILRHQMTTRNVFAVIYRASLVGLSLYQALSDLHARMEKYRAPTEPDVASQITRYMEARGLDDPRGDVDSSVSLLAWTERPGVQWASGWREAFLHCAGMHTSRLERCADWRHVASLTKALVERSWLEMRLRVQSAEERLAEFSYGDMWSGSFAPLSTSNSSSGSSSVGSARAAADRFRNFLISYYGQTYGSWPPTVRDSHPDDDGEEEQMWLTRRVARALQHDFAALYDYLVDRDIVWDVSEARAGRKWMMASKGGDRRFEADVYGMPMTDVLIEFDNRTRLPHIPHPHPLLPESIPVQTAANTGGGGMFRSSSQPQRHAGRERRVALAYTQSTNIDALGSSYSPSPLVDAFVRFEKCDFVAEVDPQMARRGRWVLIYGILQTLAGIAVDAPGIRYSDNVGYHLSARLKKPSWCRERGMFVDVKHEMSHCWVAPQTWDEQEREGVEEQDKFPQEVLLPSPRLQFGARSPTRLDGASVHVGAKIRQGAYAYRRSAQDPVLLDLPSQHGDLNSPTRLSSPSMTSLRSFLSTDDQRGTKNWAVRGHEVHSETPIRSPRMSPIIRDFDEEP
ncbi:hypothetical protein ACO1O0_009213 [Amphichorda felina]